MKPINYFWNQKHGANRIFKYNTINYSNGLRLIMPKLYYSINKKALVLKSYQNRCKSINVSSKLTRTIKLTSLSKTLHLAPNTSSNKSVTNNKNDLDNYIKHNQNTITKYKKLEQQLEVKQKQYNQESERLFKFNKLCSKYELVVLNNSNHIITYRKLQLADMKSVQTSKPVHISSGNRSKSSTSNNSSPASASSNITSSKTRSHGINTKQRAKTTSNRKSNKQKYVQSNLF